MWLDRCVSETTHRTARQSGSAEDGGAVPDQLPLSRSSIAWKVNAEPAVFLGGGRALLLQVAHPGVGAGVEQHSSYARDPWGRLFRTVDVMMKLSFASPEVSARQQRLLDKMHRRVRGVTDDGTPYDAHDTELQLWVWATLVDTALVVYERLRPALSLDEREQYYEESKLVAHGCGVPVGACPDTWATFQRYVQGVIATELRVTDSARRVAVAAMAPPLPGPLAGIARSSNTMFTVGLLPRSVRELYGFDWSRSDQRRLDRAFVLARSAAAVTPPPMRYVTTELTLRRDRPLRIPWLQRKGAELTAQRMAEAGLA